MRDMEKVPWPEDDGRMRLEQTVHSAKSSLNSAPQQRQKASASGEQWWRQQHA